MAVDPRKLFLETVADLRVRIGRSTHYDLVRAAGLLRQLLLEGANLIDRVNRTVRLRLVYPVAAATPIGGRPGQIIFRGFGGTAIPQMVPLSTFLAYECASIHGRVFSVGDVIRVAANKEGGVHYDDKADAEDAALIQFRMQQHGITLFGGFGPGADGVAFVLHQVGLAVLGSLVPLERAVQIEVGADG